MDRKGWIVVIGCAALLVLYYEVWAPRFNTVKPVTPTSGAQNASPSPAQTPAPTPTAPAQANQAASAQQIPQLLPAEKKFVAESNLAPEKIVVLENEFVRAELTTHGGGFKTIELKQHKSEDNSHVILNRGGDLPVFNISGWTDGYSLIGYEVASADDRSVTFVRTLQPGVQLSRTYSLTGDYTFALDQTVSNQNGETKALSPYRLALGVATPIHPADRNERRYISLAWLTKAGSYANHTVSEFDPATFLGLRLWSGKTVIESPAGEGIDWAAVKSQFFVMIVNCDGFDAQGVDGQRQYFPNIRKEAYSQVPDGIAAEMTVPGVRVDPNTTYTQKFSLYAGPKEDSRLRAMNDQQDRVMDFGWLAWISRALLILMNWIYSFTHNYGISIILITIILRAILWYPQSMANRSMKRMQAVSPLMKEIQEKYKDKPEKLNEEMLKIYQDYGVNPVGSCLPLLIQFPIFLGFYYMLQSAIELRYHSFLWITDLSQPDTVAHLAFPGFELPINPMPLVMTATMFISMQLTPQPAGTDNNPAFKMMKFMPLFFLLFCYNFSSALSLYWTMQNILSIVQMRYNLKQAAPSLERLKLEAQERRKRLKKR